MSNIKIGYTRQGVILGDYQEGLNESYTVRNPVVVNSGAQNLSLFPILGFCEERELTIRKDELAFNGELFTPVVELRNHYSSQFGSGIQLPG